jgi:hypothetical protein
MGPTYQRILSLSLCLFLPSLSHAGARHALCIGRSPSPQLCSRQVVPTTPVTLSPHCGPKPDQKALLIMLSGAECRSPLPPYVSRALPCRDSTSAELRCRRHALVAPEVKVHLDLCWFWMSDYK